MVLTISVTVLKSDMQRKDLKGKKRNSNTRNNSTATVLAHIMQYCSNIGKEPARMIQLVQQLTLNKGLKKFGERGTM